MKRTFSWPVLVTPAEPLQDTARDRRVAVRAETAARNRVEAREQADLLRARADPSIDVLRTSIDDKDVSSGPPATGLGGLDVIPQESTARPAANPQKDGDDEVRTSTGKSPIYHPTRYPDDMSPLISRISAMEVKFEKRFEALLSVVEESTRAKAGNSDVDRRMLDKERRSTEKTGEKDQEKGRAGTAVSGSTLPFGSFADLMANPHVPKEKEEQKGRVEYQKNAEKQSKEEEKVRDEFENNAEKQRQEGKREFKNFAVGKSEFDRGSSSIDAKKRSESRTAEGLAPIKTMVSAFARVVDYRNYRLRNSHWELSRRESIDMFHLKQQIDGLHPSMDMFDGRKPIRLLSFLATLRDTFDTLGTSEAAAVRVSAYFLGGEAKDVHAEQFALVEYEFDGDSPNSSDHGTWPHVVNALIRRFLTDDVLRSAYDAVARAEQMDEEDEAQFADRVSKASRLCRHVFGRHELVNYYVQGLNTAVREVVAQQVRQMGTEDQASLSAVRQVASAVGRSQRALMSGQSNEDRSPMDDKSKVRRAKKTVLLTPPVPMMIGSSNFESTDPSEKLEGTSIIDVAVDLGSILFASAGADPPKEGMMTASGAGTSTPMGDERILNDLLGPKSENPLMREQVGIPRLNDGQIRQAVTVIPAEYWALSCWTCRQEGHSTYGCPYLTAEQRLYFAYQYYLYQIKANPLMAKYLEERLERRLIKDKGKTEVANSFVGERGRGFDDRHSGFGRGSADRSERNVKWAPRGRGRTPYPGSARRTDQRGVYNIVESDSGGEGPIGDEWGRGPRGMEADQLDKEEGKE